MVRPILLTSLKNNLTKPFDLLFIDFRCFPAAPLEVA